MKKARLKPGPKPGPPALRRYGTMGIRLNLAERAALDAAADAAGQATGVWARNVLMKAAAKVRGS